MTSEAESDTGANTGSESGSDTGAESGAEPGPIGLLEGLATTRSIRRYLPDPIPDEDLASIMWHASRAPSGSNRQMFRFVVLRDGPVARQAKALLGRCFREGWNSKRSGDGYTEGSGAADNSPKARMARTMQHFVDHFEETPVVILACLVRYRKPTYAEGASVYPAVQNLMLAARALGYGGVITGWHRAVEDELCELLGIPEGVAIHVTIPLGRPAGRHGPVRRRPLRELVYEDRWEQDAPWAVDPPDTRFTSAGPPPGSPV
ncbi:nitroreductase family protein [Candidatus Poriferisodalis sp.]|uniref:nitroreductase family protein n=1 Tax=Candidatus Poriferisodalis sp. TaxID=3101277 RepID=UPI003C6ED4F3